MTASTTIGILSVLIVGLACAYSYTTGAPTWLSGNEANVFLKASGVIGLTLLAEKLWRDSNRV